MERKMNIKGPLFLSGLILMSIFMLSGCFENLFGSNDDDDNENEIVNRPEIYKEYHPFAVVSESISALAYKSDAYMLFGVKNISDSVVCNAECTVLVQFPNGSQQSRQARFLGDSSTKHKSLEPGLEATATVDIGERDFYSEDYKAAKISYEFSHDNCGGYENKGCPLEVTGQLLDRTPGPDGIPRATIAIKNTGIYRVTNVSGIVYVHKNGSIVASEDILFDYNVLGEENTLYEDIIDPNYEIMTNALFTTQENLFDATFTYEFNCERYVDMTPKLEVTEEVRDFIGDDNTHALRITIRNTGNVAVNSISAVISAKKGDGEWLDPLMDVARDVKFAEGKILNPGETAESTAVFLGLDSWEGIWFYYSWSYEAVPEPDAQ